MKELEIKEVLEGNRVSAGPYLFRSSIFAYDNKKSNLNIEADIFKETIGRWNEQCCAGRDRDFHRPPGTMMPIERPPFYTIPVWPIITNTQGGPVHNAKQQVVDPYGKPIPRLYKAGEMGSVFGHLYMLAGNNAECFIGGKIAGTNAAGEKPWC